jgi:muramoyltetrapeptide carboxypeptidase
MSPRPFVRVAIVAPSRPLSSAHVETLMATAASHPPAQRLDLLVHPQCYETSGHFAGTDESRLAALVSVANDPDVDAVWFARGGYGAGRIAEAALAAMTPLAKQKQYLGYSDSGFLLAGLYRDGFRHIAHGPMPGDGAREGGAAALTRALSYLAGEDDGIEPFLTQLPAPVVAFNLTVLSHLCGTALLPDLTGHVLHIEEVDEHHYRIDRALCHVMQQPWAKRLAGLRLGRCAPIPPNDTVDFGQSEEDIAKHWCQVGDVPYLGRADIGHDVGNKIVPFGRG